MLPQTLPIKLNYTLSNSLEAVMETTQEVYGYLVKINVLTFEKIQNLQLARIELLANVVEHGNLEIDSNKKIALLKKKMILIILIL